MGKYANSCGATDRAVLALFPLSDGSDERSESMTDKAKKQDLQIWTRMGRELAALHDLIVHIICDPDYNDVMDKRTWGRLNGLTYHLDTVRSRAEDRMARYVPDWSTRTFYPRDRGDLEAAIQDFRQKMDNGTGGSRKNA